MINRLSLIFSIVVFALTIVSTSIPIAGECEDYAQGMRLVSEKELSGGKLNRPIVLGHYLVGVNNYRLNVVDVAQPDNPLLAGTLEWEYRA